MEVQINKSTICLMEVIKRKNNMKMDKIILKIKKIIPIAAKEQVFKEKGTTEIFSD